MARGQQRDTLRGSLLDRLTGMNGASGTFGAIDHADLKRALQRDLNWLLNTRSWMPEDLDDLEEVGSSMLVYGVPDFTTLSWKSVSDQKIICRLLEEAVRNFEPRLIARTVRVSPPDEDDDDDAILFVRLRIEGVLNVEPYTEPVSFDTEVEVATGAVSVEKST
jgi:type VI secretion system protein ImpF